MEASQTYHVSKIFPEPCRLYVGEYAADSELKANVQQRDRPYGIKTEG